MKARLLAALVTTALAVTACGSSDDADTTADVNDGRTVILKDIAFKPDALSIAVGETVTWRFEDGGIAHNVIAEDESFQSETTDSGRFTHTFEKAGKFRYICTLHPIMKGVIQVT